jgi:hypothetical protein
VLVALLTHASDHLPWVVADDDLVDTLTVMIDRGFLGGDPVASSSTPS